MTVRVLIIADIGSMRLALEADQCRIVGECVAGLAAVELAVSTGPDVVVLGWTTPEPSGLELIRQLRRAVPGTRIVVCSSRQAANPAMVDAESDADRYVEMTDLAGLVTTVVRPTASGEPSASETAAALRTSDPVGHRQLSPKPEPFRVLVVDDDPTARRLLRLSLEMEGAEVTEAASLAEARDRLGDHFDGVVLDRRLPDGDGLDLLPVLAKQYPRSHVVVCSNVEDHAEPWFVVHVPKTEMAGVAGALGLVRRDNPGAAIRGGPEVPLTEIVRLWITRLGHQLPDPAASATHALITQILDGRAAGAESEAILPAARAEVTVRRLVDLREVLCDELVRQVRGDSRAGTLAAVNRELDAKILAVVARDVDRLRRQASTDPLTGLLNRRAFNEALDLEVARASRYFRPFSVVIADLDGLKAINDRQGHPAGDAALVAMATAIRGTLRISDSGYRVGGDEFVILLPETPKQNVPNVIERIKAAGAPRFGWGAATYLEDTDDSDTVIDLADQQLLAHRHDSRT